MEFVQSLGRRGANGQVGLNRWSLANDAVWGRWGDVMWDLVAARAHQRIVVCGLKQLSSLFCCLLWIPTANKALVALTARVGEQPLVTGH